MLIEQIMRKIKFKQFRGLGRMAMNAAGNASVRQAER
jgi:hypothetical protein